MPDGFTSLRSGEKRPLYGQAAAETGTLTIQASPAPTCTLYDSTGSAVAGLNGIAVTGYDVVALASPRVWLNLDSTTPASLAAGYYTLVFKFSAAGSDGITRTYEPALVLHVLDVRA